MRKCLAIAGMIIVGWAAAATSLAAQTLDKIKERGVLVVGLVIYFSYGRWHSRLAAAATAPAPASRG